MPFANNTDYDVLDEIKKRWSPRHFSDKKIEKEKLQRLFEAARWCSSSFNEQPWRFIVAHKEDEENFNTILNCLARFNKEWAATADLLVIAAAKDNFSYKDVANPHNFYDVGQAVAFLNLQATKDDLFVRQMAGFDLKKAKISFNIPDNYTPVVAFAVGYLDEEVEMDKSRERKPLDKIVFSGEWNQPTDIL